MTIELTQAHSGKTVGVWAGEDVHLVGSFTSSFKVKIINQQSGVYPISILAVKEYPNPNGAFVNWQLNDVVELV